MLSAPIGLSNLVLDSPNDGDNGKFNYIILQGVSLLTVKFEFGPTNPEELQLLANNFFVILTSPLAVTMDHPVSRVKSR